MTGPSVTPEPADPWVCDPVACWISRCGPDPQAGPVVTCELCDEPVTARGWCQAHYLRWWRTGSPTATPVPTASTRRLPKLVHP